VPGDYHRRDAPGQEELTQEFPEFCPGAGLEVLEGFVQQDVVRVLDQGQLQPVK